jgi:hypothetical protein
MFGLPSRHVDYRALSVVDLHRLRIAIFESGLLLVKSEHTIIARRKRWR